MTGKSPVDALSEGNSVIRWLMTEGRHITDAKSFLESFAACLRDAGVDVSRSPPASRSCTRSSSP